MPSIIQPSNKELARVYLQERQQSKEPPPSRERVREMMGWPLIEAEHKSKAVPELTR